MKPIFCIATIFFSFLSTINGQYRVRSEYIQYNNIKSTGILPVNVPMENSKLCSFFKNENSSTDSRNTNWDWDTIYVYDTMEECQRYSRTFDVTGKVTVLLVEKWKNNGWENNWRQLFEFDGNGYPQTDLWEIWQDTMWVSLSRFVYTFDTNGNMLNYSQEMWHGNVWTNDWKRTYTYDINGNKLTFLEETWQNNSWVNNIKETYTNNAGGNISQSIFEIWQQNSWQLNSRDTYTYDSTGKLLTMLSEFLISGVWYGSLKYTYSYDSIGNVTSKVKESWKGNSWENDWRSTYIYDDNSNLFVDLDETGSASGWIYYWKRIYTYNEFGNSVTGQFFKWQSGNWYPEMGDLGIYSQTENIYNFYYSYRYIASFLVKGTGISDILNTRNSLVVYPNPSKKTITIKYPMIINNNSGFALIFNFKGQLLIKQQVFQEKCLIDISSLQEGCYLVKLFCGNRTAAARFIVN